MEKKQLFILENIKGLEFKKIYAKWLNQFRNFMKEESIKSLINAQFHDYHFTNFFVRKSIYPNSNDKTPKYFYIEDKRKKRITESEFLKYIKNRNKDPNYLYYKISYMYPLKPGPKTFITIERFVVKESNISKTGDFVVIELRSKQGKTIVENLLKLEGIKFKEETTDYDSLLKEVLGPK